MDAYFVAQRYSLDLLRIRGVIGVGASKGKILVFVEDPKVIPLLPKALEGIPLEIEVRKPFEFLQLKVKVDPTEKLRPVPAGCSIGVPLPIPGFPRGVTGTLGAWAFADGRLSILSNNHVLAGFNRYPLGSPTIQPGPFDEGKPEDQVAALSHFVPIITVPFGTLPSPENVNYVDVALSEITLPWELAERAIIEIGEPLAFNLTPSEGMKVRKFGRTSGLTEGEITSINFAIPIRVPGTPEIAFFVDLILAELRGERGDSGSVVLDERNQVLGLLFAGREEFSAICKIEHIVRQLEVELAILPPPPPFPTELLFGAVALGAVGGLVRRIVERKQVFADTAYETVGFGEFNLLKFALEEAFKRATGKLIEEIIE